MSFYFSLSWKGVSTLERKNFLLQEKILFFKNWSYFGWAVPFWEAKTKSQWFLPLNKWRKIYSVYSLNFNVFLCFFIGGPRNRFPHPANVKNYLPQGHWGSGPGSLPGVIPTFPNMPSGMPFDGGTYPPNGFIRPPLMSPNVSICRVKSLYYGLFVVHTKSHSRND